MGHPACLPELPLRLRFRSDSPQDVKYRRGPSVVSESDHLLSHPDRDFKNEVDFVVLIYPCEFFSTNTVKRFRWFPFNRQVISGLLCIAQCASSGLHR